MILSVSLSLLDATPLFRFRCIVYSLSPTHRARTVTSHAPLLFLTRAPRVILVFTALPLTLSLFSVCLCFSRLPLLSMSRHAAPSVFVGRVSGETRSRSHSFARRSALHTCDSTGAHFSRRRAVARARCFKFFRAFELSS